MYSISWAQELWSGYKMLCTRAQQIERCIVQDAENRDKPVPLSCERIEYYLVKSIAGHDKGLLWREFKRLAKKTPLDTQLLTRVTTKLCVLERDEYLQGEFDFKTT